MGLVVPSLRSSAFINGDEDLGFSFINNTTMEHNNNRQPQSQLFFDPAEHPDDTLKSFNDFIQLFELRYNAQFPDPPKVSLDTALTRWKITNTSEANPDPKPSLEQYDNIVSTWQSKDKVAKMLGMFSSTRFHSDWVAAKPDEEQRKTATWDVFLNDMRVYYQPTENLTLKNYHFRSLNQSPSESFASFCNKVEKEAKHCTFKCNNADCTAENTAIRDQIVIGTTDNKIREEALMKSWDLPTLRREGMRMESAAKGGAVMSGEGVNRIGKYSHRNMSANRQQKTQHKSLPTLTCFNCAQPVNIPIKRHLRTECIAIGKTCDGCGRQNHLTQCCRTTKVNQMEVSVSNVQQPLQDTNLVDVTDTYNINIFHIEEHSDTHSSELSSTAEEKSSHQPSTHNQIPAATNPNGHLSETAHCEYEVNIHRIATPKNKVLPNWKSQANCDFRAPVVVNNQVASPISDTGAKVSVCGTVQAKRWNLLSRMVPSQIRLKPYNSSPIPVLSVARCAATFGSTSMPVECYIISGSCEPILSGNSAL